MDKLTGSFYLVIPLCPKGGDSESLSAPALIEPWVLTLSGALHLLIVRHCGSERGRRPSSATKEIHFNCLCQRNNCLESPPKACGVFHCLNDGLLIKPSCQGCWDSQRLFSRTTVPLHWSLVVPHMLEGVIISCMKKIQHVWTTLNIERASLPKVFQTSDLGFLWATLRIRRLWTWKRRFVYWFGRRRGTGASSPKYPGAKWPFFHIPPLLKKKKNNCLIIKPNTILVLL